MIYVIFYLILCAIAAYLVSHRTIGFWGGFVISLLLSPLLGFILGSFFKRKEEIYNERRMVDFQQQTASELAKMNATRTSTVDELEKLAKLKTDGHITEEEYNRMKSKLL